MYKILLLIMLIPLTIISAQNVVINEIMSSNTTTLFDEDSDTPDWIELYNSGDELVDLSGYGLSDDSLDIQKWQFENTVINPKEYLIVFASDKDRKTDNLHTNFKISASGEKIILSDASGTLIDQVEVPILRADISYARISDGSLPWVLQIPSPNLANTGKTYEGFADEISVSVPGGFYPSIVTVELSAGDSKIYYTLDGSDPDINSTEYLSSISIQKTSVLKAISVKDNYLPTPAIYQTYLINEITDLPVISLSSDPKNLFDFRTGIYTNYEEEWEKPAHVEFFDDDSNIGFSENVGINIYGGYTRSFAQKSFGVKFKSEYGNNKLEYDLFPGFRLKTFKSFILRNSGNDFDYTHIRDAVMHKLIKDLDIDYLEYRPATTYINGEYWGIYNIREKISEHYIANRHNVDPDNIDMMEGGERAVIHGDNIHYQKLIDYISTNDMATDEAYSFIDSMIDLDECLLYFAAQIYFNNQDWPGNNIKYWRERTENGKWRWILYDLDFGFNLYENNGQAENHLTFTLSPVETRYSNKPEATLLQRKLVENPKIVNQFVNQFADLLNTNFKSERVVNTINQLSDHISKDIGRHRARFNHSGENLDKMTSFAQERPGYLRDFVRDYFNSGDDGQVNLNSTEGGIIKLNSLTFDSNDLPWSGVYFQNNNVQLKAIPKPGYKFDGWSGAVTSEEDSINASLNRTTSFTATFSIDNSSTSEIVINEINYHSSDLFDTDDWIELYNTSDQTVDISNWIFADSDTAHKFIFPTGTTIESNQYLVLVKNDSAFTSLFPEVNNYVGEMGFSLSNGGEFIKLVNDKGVIIDSLTYDDHAPWPAEADGSGSTLELINPLSDNSFAVNWKASTANGTPGRLNGTPTSVEENENIGLPSEFSLSQNYPNPFNPSTIISYNLAEKNYTTLKVYDILGKEVAVLVNGEQQAGSYKVEFNTNNLASGIYLYSLSSGQSVKTKKMVLLR